MADHDGIHLLAITAHPDDAELLCGGLLLKCADRGQRTALLDLTAGEAGSAGSLEDRGREAAAAARILGVRERRTAGLPDGEIANRPEHRWSVARHIRELRPRVVVLQYDDRRHPDHRVGGVLARDACFLAGLGKAPIPGEPYRPHKIIYGLAYREHGPVPTFVVDISEQMERKLDAVFAYESQFRGRTSIGSILGGGGRGLREQILAHHAHYGSYIRRDYGEPYWTPETLLVEDVATLEPRSM